MYYASFGILSMILGFIINHEYLWKRKNKTYTPAGKRYRAFLFAAMLYYVSDILWGYLYSTRIVPLVYADTVLYFLSMVLSVLMWTRFVVKYINATGLFGEILAFEGWAIFAFEILCLIVNFFNPIIFEFAWDGEYMPHYIRYITLAIQVALFLMASVYTIFCAAKSEGKLRIQNITIGVSGIVMSVFIVLQTLYPLLPFYAIGLCIGNCLIHVFVEEVVRIDRAIEMRELQKKADEERREIIKVKKKNITFNRIAESLAANYDIIYYVDTRDDSYIGYNSDYMRGQLEEQLSGDNFFEDAIRDTARIIVPEDQERLLTFLDRDYLLTALDVRKQFVADYRMLVDDKPQYTRLIARKSCSGEHFIIAVENVDAEVRQEKEQEKALKSEKQLARHDELTGTKNKTAYIELEQSVQDNLDKGVGHQSFGLVVCDINDLKKVNDNEGHQAGDDLIRCAAKMICDVFAHSPVFRIGGDEFVVFLSGDDFNAREELVGRLRVGVFQHMVQKNGPVVAVGVAAYKQERDRRMSDVFERADKRMYMDKQELKKQSL